MGETLTISIPLSITVQEVIYETAGGSELNADMINGGEVNGGSAGSYTITRLTVPIQLELLDRYVLGIPLSITLVSYPFQLSIPIAVSNFENLSLQLPVSVSVAYPRYNLIVPIQIHLHESYMLQAPIRLQVYPVTSSGVGGQGVGAVVQLPANRSQQWSLQVLLRGLDVSGRLVGSVSIDEEESSAAIAVFTLRLTDGVIDPYEWVKAPVEISYIDVGNGVSHLKFKGIVDTPNHDATRNLTEFTCTDNLQNVVRSMTHAQVDELTPLSKWSSNVFDEQVDSWDYLQDRLATYPYAVKLDVNGYLSAYNFQASSIIYEFTDSTILDGSLLPSLANAREITNQVNVSVDVQFELFRESVAKIRWEGEFVVPFGLGAAICWTCGASMPVDAIQGTGAYFVDDPLFGVQGPNRYVHGLAVINPGVDLIIEGFQGLASKRFMQPITHNSTFSVQSSDSIAQLGIADEDLSTAINVVYNDWIEEAFNRTKTQNKWLCSAGTSLQTPRLTASSYLPNDPFLPVTDGTNMGFITYPLLPISYNMWDPNAIPNLSSRAYHLDAEGNKVNGMPLYGEVLYDFDDFILEGKITDQVGAQEALVAEAKVKVLSTHRQNRLGFTTFINPLLSRGQTIRVNTNKVKATGVIYQLQHVFDIDKGTAMTNATLAISSSKVIGLLDGSYNNIRLSIPIKLNVVDGSIRSELPMDNSTINYNQVLLQHVNEDPDNFLYNNQHWGGFFTSYTATKYQEFVLEWPDMPEVNTANATVVSNGGIINVDVPNDEFYLIAG